MIILKITFLVWNAIFASQIIYIQVNTIQHWDDVYIKFKCSKRLATYNYIIILIYCMYLCNRQAPVHAEK